MPATQPARPLHTLKTLVELGDNDCRYPYGEVGTATFGFCGEPAETGPYCAKHAARCYRSDK